ncbi:hypothetical protein ACDX78_04865 [Virgibacillus oceani]
MNKKKFTFVISLGIIAGFFIIGILRWLGLDISLANVYHTVLGEPNAITITIVSFITIFFVYFIVSRLYRKYANS